MVTCATLSLFNCSILTQFVQLVIALTLVRDTLPRHHKMIFSLTPPSYLCSHEAQGRRRGESD